MKKNSRIYIAAAVCIGIGIICTAGGIMAGGRPGVSLGSDGIRMLGDDNRDDYILEKTKLEEISAVEMNLDYGDFHLIPSDGYYLEYSLSGHSQKPKYEVNNGTLIFNEKPIVSYVQFQIMDFDLPSARGQYYVNLYVPEDVYFDTFVLNNNSGNAEIETLRGEAIKLYLGYGKLSAESIAGDTVEASLDSGDMEAGEITGGKKLEITMDYGNLQLDDCTAGELNVTLESGSLSAERLAAETLEIHDSYGGVKAEDLTVTGAGKFTLDSGNLTIGTCKAGDMEMNLEYGNLKVQSMNGESLTVDNSSGDVEIEELILEKKGMLTLEYGNAAVGLGDSISEYTMRLDTEYGKIKVPDVGRLTAEDEEESFRLEGTLGKELEIYCSSGDITVS
ncbi:MAG: DUF4097 family beta strand repeat-containing protein [Eubacteriales bacterium]|nr:DUF4097 family beta strand repeat-containing protein [Eubacteriales bacterium]